MSKTAILFVADNCTHCTYAVPRVVELFDSAAITLEVRKARLSELQRMNITGFPSLFIPYAVPPVLVVGRDIADWLVKHREVWTCPQDSVPASPS